MKSAMFPLLAACLILTAVRAEESPPKKEAAPHSLTAALDAVAAALGKEVKRFHIFNLTARPEPKLIASLADGIPASLSAKQPILVRAKHLDFALEALAKATEKLARKKTAGLHVVILASSIEPERFAALAENTGLIFHHAQLDPR